MKIAFFEITHEWEKNHLLNKLDNSELVFFDQAIQEYDISQFEDVNVLSVFIYSTITADIIDSLPNLQYITTRSTGFDHIDLDACENKSIPVSNVPFYGENTVAEHTFALLLAVSRNVHKSYLRAQRNDFSIDESLKGFDLQGKTIGIIGTGRIGIHVARIARGFGMKVIAFDINHNDFLAEILNFEYVEFEELLQQSDIVTLHVPYNEHTHHLINVDNVKHFKKGSVLINTSRGKNVETEAILQGLNDGTLAGVGLDVLEGEEYIKEDKQLMYDKASMDTWQSIVQDHMLLTNEKVVFTPHIAFYSQEALERILDTTSTSITKFQDNTLQFVVNDLHT